MLKDRVILIEDMNVTVATKEVRKLPTYTNKEDRHKFLFTKDRVMVIGRADAGNPSHGDLGNQRIDKIAGYICFTFDENKKVTHVYMNNLSKDFDYPKFEDLKEPQVFITKLFGPICVDMEDIPKPKSKLIDLSNLATH